MTDTPDLFEHAAAGDPSPAPPDGSFLSWMLIFGQDPDGRTYLGKPWDYWVDFDEWRHTPAGADIADRFLRLALFLKCHRDFDHFGAQDIVGKIRWEHALKRKDDGTGHKVGSRWKRPLSIWAMWRDERLKGFFRTKNMGGDDGE